MTILDPEGSPTEEGNAPVDTLKALAYIRDFMVDGEPFPTTDRVRPWREGYEGHVVECVGKELLLTKDINHWGEVGRQCPPSRHEEGSNHCKPPISLLLIIYP